MKSGLSIIVLRIMKILLVLSVAMWGFLGALGNLTGWNGMIGAVAAVTSMSTVVRGAASWQKTNNPTAIIAGALFITLSKALAGLMCAAGAWRMWSARFAVASGHRIVAFAEGRGVLSGHDWPVPQGG